MTALYRVWQPDRGERARHVTALEAESAEDAVKEMHRRDWESSDEQVYCVQRVADADSWGNKVHVVRSMRETVPVFTVSEPLAPARLKARCPGCGRRMLDLGEVDRDRCRRCSVRAYARPMAVSR